MKVTEQELQAKAKAPRVTQKQIEAQIVGVHYINAGRAIAAAGGAQPFDASTYRLNICIITLVNGFTVTGESACVSPENYDEDIGQALAYDHAFVKIWQLEGYQLATALAERADQYAAET